MSEPSAQQIANVAQAHGFIMAVKGGIEDGDIEPLPGIFANMLKNGEAYYAQLLREYGVDLDKLPHVAKPKKRTRKPKAATT